MEPLGVVLLVLWLIAGFFNAAKKKGQAGQRKPRAPAPASKPPRRGGMLDQLRAELERIQREAELAEGRVPPRRGPQAGPIGRRAQVRLPRAEEVEETESLEIDPVVVGREPEPGWGYREAVDLDEEAEVAAARRLREAEARNRALTLADHRAFDKAIRAPAPQPRQPSRRPALQRAMIWREVLGPPVALRPREDV